MVEIPLDGRTRTQFVDCECRPKPEPQRSSRAALRFSLRHGMKGDCRDYRDDLARFAGDPQAYVDGPRALQKLKDQRQREGWVFHDSFAQATGESIKEPEQPMEQAVWEAYERARANNFKLKEDDAA